ncbi:MAG: carboxypeptidase-like regulatory domain-containing protein [Bacteroidales bacterium]|nr:carboxypeptidase-like regulatory domain-containing protein [Bacteroidales bacterium]
MSKTFIGILVFMLFAAVFSACTEEEKNSFSGTITDMSSGEPVSGVTVYLDGAVLNSGSINSTFHELAVTTTGSDGRYFFECDQDAYLKFRIRIQKDGYHDDLHEFEPADQLANYDNDYEFAKESYLHVSVLNVLPYNDDDQFKIRVEAINNACQMCCSGEFRYFYGTYTDTSFFCNTVGGDTITLYSISIHNDESIIKSNKVYCMPGDTMFFNAYY